MVKIVPAPAMGRVMRRPVHPFLLRTRPYQIQPFLLAPVIPGETMTSLLLQARTVTDPIKNPLIGWWLEHHFFYVSHRNLEEPLFEEMMLDLELDLSSTYADADVPTYHFGGSINWTRRCLDAVVKAYFRAETDTDAHDLETLPLMGLNSDSWLDSVINDADFVTPIDIDVDENADDTITASEVDKSLRAWQYLRANQLTDMDYEDYLRTHGINTPAEVKNVPELIRSLRSWQYPSNTVEPTTGVPSSAVSWVIAENASKDRFFKEPGFIIGVQVTRPKVYLSGQAGSAAGIMNDALAWLPAIMRDDPYTSLRKLEGVVVEPAAPAEGPLTANTDAYWVDVKDLLLYGDQFVNFALTETDAGMVGLPTAALEKRYPSSADIDALFAGTNKTVRTDGVVNLNIKGAQVDTTPQVSRRFV